MSQIPLGIGSLMSNIDAETEFCMDKKDLIDCDWIGLSSGVVGLNEAIEILQSTDIPVIIGGMGCLWGGLQEYPFKHIVTGDGERALNNIIEGRNVPKIVDSMSVVDINKLNFPELGKLNQKVIPIMSSRGCPFNCAFCTSHVYWKGVRYHSAEYVLAEIDYYIDMYPEADEIYLLDDIVTLPPSRFETIYNGWMSRGLNKTHKLRGFVRADTLDFITLKRLQEMGMSFIRFGAESGSNRMLKLLNKRSTVNDYKRVIEWCKELDLPVSASFMYGLPFETPTDIKLTEEFIKETGIQKGGWYEFKAFPGTALYNGENPLEVDMRVR